MDKQDLVKLARTPMPFGKYRGRYLMDLPEAYLLWFERQGFPSGKLGELLSLALELRRDGLTYLLRPLRPSQGEVSSS